MNMWLIFVVDWWDDDDDDLQCQCLGCSLSLPLVELVGTNRHKIKLQQTAIFLVVVVPGVCGTQNDVNLDGEILSVIVLKISSVQSMFLGLGRGCRVLWTRAINMTESRIFIARNYSDSVRVSASWDLPRDSATAAYRSRVEETAEKELIKVLSAERI